MKPAREPIWWLPLARRVLGWGAALTAITGILPFAIVVGMLLASRPFEPYQDASYIAPQWWQNLPTYLSIAGILASPFWLSGLALGALCGFYAPATEPKHPLHSRFFRAVAGPTYAWTLACFVPTALALGCTLRFGLGWRMFWGGWMIILALCFGLSLWRALNRALRAARVK